MRVCVCVYLRVVDGVTYYVRALKHFVCVSESSGRCSRVCDLVKQSMREHRNVLCVCAVVLQLHRVSESGGRCNRICESIILYHSVSERTRKLCFVCVCVCMCVCL